MAAHKRTPTIQDVARAAGVSAATVSRVLSAPEKVSETTRERVTAAVLETGYTINQAARSLRMKAARTILMAAPNIGNPYYSTITDAVIGEAAERGYGVLVTSRIGDDPSLWLRDYLLSTRADGLLLFDGALDTNRLHGLSLPLVAAYDELPDPKVNSVITDNREAAQRAVEHLIALGHRAIGNIALPPRNQTTSERLIGFRAALSAAGISVREDWLVPGNYDMASGRRAAEHFLTLAERPTAVFCANDEMAIGFIHRMRQAGVHCPADISVIGFDDTAVAEFYDPPLTTMRQPREDIGRMAARTVIDIIEGHTGPDPVHVVLRSELVVRESTRAVAS